MKKEVLAHKKENALESLDDHSQRTFKYANNLLKIVINEKNKILDAIRMHDEGKKGQGFQEKIKNGDTSLYSDHALPSSLYFLQKYADYLNDLTILLAYLISKHHSDLDMIIIKKFFIESDDFSLSKLEKKLKEYLNLFSDLDKEIFDKLRQKKLNLKNRFFTKTNKDYILVKLINSLLISADYYATYEFFAEEEVKNFGRVDNVSNLFKKFKKEYSKILNAPNKTKLNQIRTELSLKAEENLLKNKDKKIFFLNAPTGAGKTLMSLNLASNMDIEKIFYVFPFNTIVDQTAQIIDNYFSNNYRVINSITGLTTDEYKTEKIERVLLNTDMLHYPIIITSSVNMFEIFFSNKKEKNFNFWQLQNSLIIFDEVQSIPLELIKPFMEFIEALTETLNCKVILMSATLPYKLFEKYIKDKNNVTILLDEKTLRIKEFKNRVKIKKLGELEDLDELKDKIKNILSSNNFEKVLIEFFKKDIAIKFYDLIKDEFNDYEILLITGDTDKITRLRILNTIKEDKKVILISTQVIEAGVDIDMDIGFKQITTFESEEQFLGRINRNANKKGDAYFFTLKGVIENSIYKDARGYDYLTLRNDEVFEIFVNKDIYKFYEKLSKEIETFELDINFKLANKLDFLEIDKKMKLIKDNTIQIFIPFEFELNLNKKYEKYIKDKYENFVFDSNVLDGKKVLDYYLSLNKLDFKTKKKELYYLKELISLFVINTYNNSIKDYYGYFEKIYDGFYYLKSEYIEDIFDLEKRCFFPRLIL